MDSGPVCTRGHGHWEKPLDGPTFWAPAPVICGECALQALEAGVAAVVGAMTWQWCVAQFWGQVAQVALLQFIREVGETSWLQGWMLEGDEDA